jgi:hypothetical protein
MKASVVPANYGSVEMAGHVDRVVHQHVELLGAEHNAGNAADEAEEDQRQEHS